MKRFLDFIFSLLALIILSPAILIISILVLISSGRPIIFKQERVGYKNTLFTIYKFRTMKDGMRQTKTEDLTEEEIENDITFIGKILRKLSLDELPQLLNILKGDMSFVGPRPLIPQEKEIRKLREENNVFSVRPGITGWAQVNGRDFISDEQKVKYDKEYVEKHTIVMDIRIMFKTFWVVLAGKDIADGNINKEGDEK
ncbi:MAG: sugar transferase [Ruminococcaceae bacterium]|nr:sugar transferase [Oscillospiraceae bacterium]